MACLGEDGERRKGRKISERIAAAALHLTKRWSVLKACF
jgi:hypothetical protein